jgi:hypothetical protein
MTRNLQQELLKLKETLEIVEQDFQKKELEIQQKSEKFTSIDKIIEDIIKQNDYVIRLNIGGKIFTTRLSLMAANKDTLFYSIIFKYAQSQNFPKEIFIDRNYIHFPIILEYLRYKKISMTKYQKSERDEIKKELEFYRIDLFSKSKKVPIDLEWDQLSSKSAAFTVDMNDSRLIKIHSTSCYTHFITNYKFTNENFVVEFQSNVTQRDNYYYIGIMNELYNTASSCNCCNPTNCYYLQKDGSVHINGSRTTSSLNWSDSSNLIIGMKVLLSEKMIYFYKDTPENEIGPYAITSGSSFRVYIGHCNSGNGELFINECYLL